MKNPTLETLRAARGAILGAIRECDPTNAHVEIPKATARRLAKRLDSAITRETFAAGADSEPTRIQLNADGTWNTIV